MAPLVPYSHFPEIFLLLIMSKGFNGLLAQPIPTNTQQVPSIVMQSAKKGTPKGQKAKEVTPKEQMPRKRHIPRDKSQ